MHTIPFTLDLPQDPSTPTPPPTHQSPPLQLLLLLRAVLASHEALGKQLLGAAGGLDVQEGIVGILDHAMAKGTHAKLGKGPVV